MTRAEEREYGARCGQCGDTPDKPIRGRCGYCGSAYYWTTDTPSEDERAQDRCDAHKGALDRMEEGLAELRSSLTWDGVRRMMGE